MKLIKLKLIISFLLITAGNLYPQFYSNDMQARVGDKIYIDVKYNGRYLTEQEALFEADLFISNPTVFYPLNLYSGDNTSISQSFIERLTDSTYHISMLIIFEDDFQRGEITFRLKGEMLAGNDSVTTLIFSKVVFGDSTLGKFSLMLKSSSAPGFINYVRFARIIEYYPNPVNTGDKTYWVYHIDKKSTVKFYLYDLEMKRILIQNLGIVEKGMNTFEFIPDKSFSAGEYWVGMESNSGYVYKRLIIIK